MINYLINTNIVPRSAEDITRELVQGVLRVLSAKLSVSLVPGCIIN